MILSSPKADSLHSSWDGQPDTLLTIQGEHGTSCPNVSAWLLQLERTPDPDLTASGMFRSLLPHICSYSKPILRASRPNERIDLVARMIKRLGRGVTDQERETAHANHDASLGEDFVHMILEKLSGARDTDKPSWVFSRLEYGKALSVMQHLYPVSSEN